MKCEQALPLLSAYVDGELDVAQALEIERHAHECARCATALQQQQALRSALGAAALRFAAPPYLERQVLTALRREAGGRLEFGFAPWRWAAVPLAAALAAALSWNIAVHRGAPSGDEALLAELVSGHVRSLMVDHLVDVATSDQHTVKPWFNGKVDFAPPVVDFTASGFPLLGGRVDYIVGRPVAVAVYKRRQHVVNVFIWPAANAPDQESATTESQSYHLLHWTRSGLTFWAVSDTASNDLLSLSRLFETSDG